MSEFGFESQSSQNPVGREEESEESDESEEHIPSDIGKSLNEIKDEYLQSQSKKSDK